MRSDEGLVPDEGSERDARAARLLDEVAAIEDRLDPMPAKRGQRLADLITLALVAELFLLLDGELRYPLLLVALLVAAGVLNRTLTALTTRSLRRDRDRLLGPDVDEGA